MKSWNQSINLQDQDSGGENVMKQSWSTKIGAWILDLDVLSLPGDVSREW